MEFCPKVEIDSTQIIKKMQGTQIHDFIKEIKSDNFRHKEFIQKRKNELQQELSENGKVNKRIGINKIRGAYMSGCISASDDFIMPDREVIVENDLFSIKKITTGNLDDVYETTLDKIKKKDNLNFEEITKLVYQTITDYFGKGHDIQKRLELLPDEDSEEIVGVAKLTDFKGQNAAMCVERALLSQNIFKLIGVNSTLKLSQITFNGDIDGHAYNILRYKDKFYIYDSSIPTIDEKGEVLPLVKEISEKEYVEIIKENRKDGCKIETNYFAPTKNQNVQMIYDSMSPSIEELENNLKR